MLQVVVLVYQYACVAELLAKNVAEHFRDARAVPFSLRAAHQARTRERSYGVPLQRVVAQCFYRCNTLVQLPLLAYLGKGIAAVARGFARSQEQVAAIIEREHEDGKYLLLQHGIHV